MIITGTFDVIDGNYSVTDITTGTVCFMCYFIKGSTTNTCYIEYSSLYTGVIGNTTINRISLMDNSATSCLNGFYTDIYTVRFYDDKHDESPAIELVHQMITGLSFVDNIPTTSCSYVITESYLLYSSSLAPSPSPSAIDCTSNG